MKGHSMPVSNPLRKFVDKVNQYPAPISAFLMTKVFRHKVKLAGTTSIDVVATNGRQVEYRMKNRKKVQNHIGSVHAAAMALLAESATGFIVGINLPGDKLPLIKCMNLNYVKRATGDMKAIATLTDEQIALLEEQEKGEVNVHVKVTDATGIEPVECEMIWAWVPKR
tara:strand:+ start:412 stop:915 length:504 start_codon:yes stop_codon:yes gene_type:complete